MTGIVILNYNTYKETIELVEALQRQTIASGLYIIVVDNASPNCSFEQLQPLENRFGNVRVLQTGENLGYAKGNNYGLRYLEEKINPEYVAVLNNDIVLPDNCFEKLMMKYRTLDNPCLIAPLQYNPEEKVSIMGHLPTFCDDLLNLSFVYRRLHKNKIKLIDNTGLQAMKVDMISGSFMFASMERFKRIGLFYPKTFLYAEERFVAYNAKQVGFNNYLLLDEYYVHQQGISTNTVLNLLTKYRFQYEGWIKYTKACRKNGRLKAFILKPLIQLSLWEIRLVGILKKK